MKIAFHVSGDQRKAFVQAMGEVLQTEPVYLGAPTFCYTVGAYSEDKEGIVTVSEERDMAAIQPVLNRLAEEYGWQAKSPETGQQGPHTAETSRPGSCAVETAEDGIHLTISLPCKDFSDTVLSNIQNIVDSKQTVLKKALGVTDLPIEIREDVLAFPWFTLHGLPGEAEAYRKLVGAIIEQAKDRKRTKSEELTNGNENYVMRLFLIRLGFIGEDYKAARKLLLRNLSGNSSWKEGAPTKKDRKEGENAR